MFFSISARWHCFSFQKSIKSQRVSPRICRTCYCFSFQKSIKSQRSGSCREVRHTVSHSKRASNHNSGIQAIRDDFTVSHSKRASNHNLDEGNRQETRTVSHSKRASNHNNCAELCTAHMTVSHSKRASNHNQAGYGIHIPYCFSFQKSIKFSKIKRVYYTTFSAALICGAGTEGRPL